MASNSRAEAEAAAREMGMRVVHMDCPSCKKRVSQQAISWMQRFFTLKCQCGMKARVTLEVPEEHD